MADPLALFVELGEDLAMLESARESLRAAELDFLALGQAGRLEEAEQARARVLAYKEAELDAFMAACVRLKRAADQIRDR